MNTNFPHGLSRAIARRVEATRIWPIAIPGYVKPLIAAHPQFKEHYLNDPALRAFVKMNRNAIGPSKTDGSVVSDQVTWDAWVHGNALPEGLKEYHIVVACGDANDGKVVFRKGKELDGRIVMISRTDDIGQEEKYPNNDGFGGFVFETQFPVSGQRGSEAKLYYVRGKPGADGMLPMASGWPNIIGGAYDGRDSIIKISGTPHHIGAEA